MFASNLLVSNLLQLNVAYSLHFYAHVHTQWLRDITEAVLAQGNVALFASEWGMGFEFLDEAESVGTGTGR